LQLLSFVSGEIHVGIDRLIGGSGAPDRLKSPALEL